MPHEVACVDISPLGGQEDGKASFCAIGLWTEISVSLLKLPSLQQVDNQLLGGGMHGGGFSHPKFTQTLLNTVLHSSVSQQDIFRPIHSQF